MATWWIDSTYIGNLIGTTQRDAITGASSSVFDQFENAAVATVRSTLMATGYDDPGASLTSGSVAAAFLQKLAAGMWIRDAYANRKGIQLPSAALDAADLMNAMLKDARSGTRLAPPVPGLSRNTLGGIGGASFPSSSNESTSAAARPPRFDRASLRGY